jgi:hypothetical protein
MNHVQQAPCGCRVIGSGATTDPYRIEFCPLHHDQQGTIAVTLVRLEQLRQSITARDWNQTEFQFDRVLRSLTKQL